MPQDCLERYGNPRRIYYFNVIPMWELERFAKKSREQWFSDDSQILYRSELYSVGTAEYVKTIRFETCTQLKY